MLHDYNFDLSPELYLKWKNSNIDEKWKSIEIPKEYDYLFDYQIDAMKYSIYHNNRIILALRMGEGKTATTLSIMDYIAEFPALIISPSIVKYNWAREYKKFINKEDKIKIIESSKDMINYHGEYDIYIINYELIARHVEKEKDVDNFLFFPDKTLRVFKRNNFAFVAIDELHKMKNPDAQTTNGIKFLVDTSNSIIGLTGTPLLSSAKDLFTSLNLFLPDMFNNYFRFCNRYCYTKVNYSAGRITEYYGARNSAELNNVLVNNVMFRVTEGSNRFGEKPIISVIPIKMSDKSKYEEIEKTITEETGFSIIDKLKKEAWEQKKKGVFEFIDEMLEETDDKIVIFYHNKNVADDIIAKYKKIAVKIDGSVSTKGDTRDKIIEKFTNDKKLRLFLGSISAVGTATNGLQHASHTMIFLQWPWVSAEVDQAIARLYRQNQTERVNVYHLPAENTIEEMFMDILDRKTKIFKEVIDAQELSEKDTLKYLMDMTKSKVGGVFE